MATTLFASTYAKAAGVVLVLAGLAGIVSLAAGYVGLLGSAQNLDNAFIAWDNTLSALWIVLGAAALYVGFAGAPRVDRLAFSKAFGGILALLGVLGLAAPAALPGIRFQLGENLLDLLLGALGLVAGFFTVPADEPLPGPGLVDVSPPPRAGEAASLDWRGPAAEVVIAGLTPAERRQPIEATEGIGDVYGQKLRAEGATTLEEFLRKSPDDLALSTGIEQTLVRKWHSQGQFQAIHGIGPQFSELLVRAGIETMDELAGQKPGALAKKLADYQASLEVRVEGRKLTSEMTGDWIKQARGFVKQLGREPAPEPAEAEVAGAPSGA